jgi:hypothetical protein
VTFACVISFILGGTVGLVLFGAALRHYFNHHTECGGCGRTRTHVLIIVPPQGKAIVAFACDACYAHYERGAPAPGAWMDRIEDPSNKPKVKL